MSAAEEFTSENVSQLVEAVRSVVKDEPIATWPEMPRVAYYGIAGEIARTIEPHTEADPAAILLSLLTVVGVSIGYRPYVMAGPDRHPARLFVVIVGNSAKARKGTSWGEVVRIIEVADPDLIECRQLGGFGSGETLVDSLHDLAEEPGSEARMLVHEAEFARVLKVCDRDGSTLSPIIRQAWDGNKLEARSRGKTSVVPAPHLVGMLGHITSNELKTRLTSTETANGFANRIMFGCARRSKLRPRGGSLDQRTVNQLGKALGARIREARKVGECRRTPAAERLWDRLYREMNEDDGDDLLATITARDSAHLLRVSLLYALLDGSDVIDVAHVEAAAAVWQYCYESASYLFGGRTGNADADRMLSAIRAAGPDGLDGRGQDRVFGGHRSAAQLAAIREMLERSQVIVTETVDTGGRPRLVSFATGSLHCGQSGESGQRSPEGCPEGLSPLNPLLPHVQHGQAVPLSDGTPPPSDEDVARWMSEDEVDWHAGSEAD